MIILLNDLNKTLQEDLINYMLAELILYLKEIIKN